MFHRAVNNLSFLARHDVWYVRTSHIRHPVFLSDLLTLLRHSSFYMHSLVNFFISFGSHAQSIQNVPLCRVTAWKMSKYGVFSVPHFPAFGLNTERYGVYTDQKELRIWSLFTQWVGSWAPAASKTELSVTIFNDWLIDFFYLDFPQTFTIHRRARGRGRLFL